MTPAPDTWPALLALLAKQPEILLLLDFDGTLAEITKRPEDSVLRPGNAALLEGLGRSARFTVGILSGRSLSDVSGRVGVPGLVYAGNHGLEIRGPGLEYVHPAAAAAIPAISDAAERLIADLSAIPGAIVEAKELTLTAHYRLTPVQYHDSIAMIFLDTVGPLLATGSCRVTAAKMAMELRPAVDWHKGRALELIRFQLASDAFPVYIGDDETDEDAFESAQSAGGAGIYVGPADTETRAVYRFNSPSDVSTALTDLQALR